MHRRQGSTLNLTGATGRVEWRMPKTEKGCVAELTHVVVRLRAGSCVVPLDACVVRGQQNLHQLAAPRAGTRSGTRSGTRFPSLPSHAFPHACDSPNERREGSKRHHNPECEDQKVQRETHRMCSKCRSRRRHSCSSAVVCEPGRRLEPEALGSRATSG